MVDLHTKTIFLRTTTLYLVSTHTRSSTDATQLRLLGLWFQRVMAFLSARRAYHVGWLWLVVTGLSNPTNPTRHTKWQRARAVFPRPHDTSRHDLRDNDLAELPLELAELVRLAATTSTRRFSRCSCRRTGLPCCCGTYSATAPDAKRILDLVCVSHTSMYARARAVYYHTYT
eukprot:COSAG02_NODE_696_length_18385_cov_48.260855_20_plen_173_part_00